MKYFISIILTCLSLSSFSQEKRVSLMSEMKDSDPILYEVCETGRIVYIYFDREDVVDYLKEVRPHGYNSFVEYIKGADSIPKFSREYSYKTHGPSDFTRYNGAMYGVAHDLLVSGKCMVVSENETIESIILKYCDGYLGTEYTEFYDDKGRFLFSLVTWLGE